MIAEEAKICELYQYRPKWGGASVDLHCFQVHSFIKFSGMYFVAMDCNYPGMSPDGTLPFLRYENALAHGENIKEFVIKKHRDIDGHLTDLEQAESKAFISLIRNKVYPAIEYAIWCEWKNFLFIIREYFADIYTFPLNYIIPMKMKYAKQKDIKKRFQSCDKETIYAEANEAIAILAEKIRRSRYFFSDEKPSEIDSYLYASFAMILNLPLPDHALKILLESKESLVKYVKNIDVNWFTQR